MNDNILMLMRELNKTDFYDGDYDVYVSSLSEKLSSAGLNDNTVKNITYFFEHVFFKDSDYSITSDFKKHVSKNKYKDFIESFDIVMMCVLSLGHDYNWPRRSWNKRI